MLDKWLDYNRDVSPSAAHREFLLSGCKCSNCKKGLRALLSMTAPIVGLKTWGMLSTLGQEEVGGQIMWVLTVSGRNPMGELNVIRCNCNCYSVDGSKINDENWMKNIFKELDISTINELECPYCEHRWLMFQKSKRIKLIDIKETRTSEEFIVEEKRVIDNLQSSSEITRTI